MLNYTENIYVFYQKGKNKNYIILKQKSCEYMNKYKKYIKHILSI